MGTSSLKTLFLEVLNMLLDEQRRLEEEKNSLEELWNITHTKLKKLRIDLFYAIDTNSQTYYEHEIQKVQNTLEDIENKLKEVEKQLQSAQPIEDLVKEYRSRIKGQIEEQCGKIKILTMLEPVDINRLYVNLKVTEKDNPERIKIPSPFETEVRKDSLRILVTGGIGSGKTTFLKILAFSCIQGEFLPEQLPIHIILRNYIEDYIQASKSKDLLDFIAEKYSLDKDCLDKILKDEKNDRCLLIFDGLDQVEESNRVDLVNKLNAFIEKYPINDYIISSRESLKKACFGYFKEIKLSKLDQEQIEDLIKKRFKVISSTEDTQSDELAKKLIEYLKNNENITKLCETPLMLALVCLEYINKGEKSLSRTETKWAIVREAVAVWLEKWKKEQELTEQTDYDIRHVENLLSWMAYKTVQDSNLYLSRERLIEYIQEFVINYYSIEKSEREKLDEKIKELLEILEDVSGITLTTSNNLYSFPHIIFRNYFGILYIGRNYKSVRDFQDSLNEAGCTKDEISNKWGELLEDANEAYDVIFGGKANLSE